MTYYIVTSELEPFAAADVTMSTTSGYFDPIYARGGMQLGVESSFMTYVFPNPISDVWVHFQVKNIPLYSSAQQFVRLVNSDGLTMAYIGAAGAGDLGRAWSYGIINSAGETVTVWAPTSPPVANLTTIDMHVQANGGASSVVTWYLNGMKIAQWSGVSSRFTDISRFTMYFGNYNLGCVVSQVIVADTITVGRKVAARYITGDGSNSDWSGPYTYVSELGVDDTTMITASSANEVSTYALHQVSGLPSDTYVEAVVLSIRSVKGASGPQNLQGVVRVGGTDYTTSSLSGVDVVQAGQLAVWTVNPATGVAWTYDEANSATLEGGVKSIT